MAKLLSQEEYEAQQVYNSNRPNYIRQLAEKLFINSLSIPHPEGQLNGIDLDSDYVPDPNGFEYKVGDEWKTAVNKEAKFHINRSWPIKRVDQMEPGPVWHRDEYGPQRRLIRECYHQAQLFYSTVEKLQEGE